MQTNAQYLRWIEILWKWYTNHKRDLPWRDLPIDDTHHLAYTILISEVMLQQTQVNRVKIVFKKFLEQFPTLNDLAHASNKQVIFSWRGMGYNNRALRLRDAARMVQMEFHGMFPEDMQQLQNLPGVGHYTAAAIRNFAFNIPTACLDTNIRRIIHRSFFGPERPDGTWKVRDAELLRVADELLTLAVNSPVYHPSDTRNWHAALMDFGSLVCKKRNPQWDVCPFTKEGLMKAAYKVHLDARGQKKQQEPGRHVGSRFIPNRIFRGRIVDALRDAKELTIEEIGQCICIDWDTHLHRQWLEQIIDSLQKDQILLQAGEHITLRD